MQSNTQDDQKTWEAVQRDALCQLGLHGQIGRIRIEVTESVERGEKILCRTARGLEVGSVLAAVASLTTEADGAMIRKMTPEDHLLWTQLQRFSQQAHEDCVRWIEEQAYSDVLLDVEPLMDGRTLYFHFLGAVSSDLTGKVEQLVELYHERVAASQFAQLLEHGCGPGCGTKEKSGCGEDGGPCAVCVVASACRK